MKNLLEKIKIANKEITKKLSDKSKTENLLIKTMKISEEVWEFYNEVLWYIWAQRKEKNHSRENLENECADIILATLLVADDLWINIEEVLNRKMEKVLTRFNLQDK